MAVALGTILALLSLKGENRRPALGFFHGLTGLAGFLVFLLAARGGEAGQAAFFATLATALLLLALSCGPFIPLLSRRAPRMSGAALVLHACAAVTGFVVFLAWTSLK